mmetsp:Transcript_10652/g.18615  ORF Transcript_10652/g.18615 Transcript_10652/m.18615 type:complete len:208 (+) Transcript_10652:350-973(+)
MPRSNATARRSRRPRRRRVRPAKREERVMMIRTSTMRTIRKAPTRTITVTTIRMTKTTTMKMATRWMNMTSTTRCPSPRHALPVWALFRVGRVSPRCVVRHPARCVCPSRRRRNSKRKASARQRSARLRCARWPTTRPSPTQALWCPTLTAQVGATPTASLLAVRCLRASVTPIGTSTTWRMVTRMPRSPSRRRCCSLSPTFVPRSP